MKSEGWSVNELKIVEVSGDSMLPRLHNRDLILVKTSCKDIKNGKVYALVYNDDLRVKRLRTRYDGALIISSDSDSPEYKDEIIPPDDIDQISIVGRVVKLVSGGGF